MNQVNNTYRGDISLVDLATIFVRRIWLFIALFVLFLVSGIAFTLLQEERYEYVSLYQAAETSLGSPVEPPQRALAVLETQWLPELEVAYEEQNRKALPFEVKLENPEATGMVKMTSTATREAVSSVEAFHQAALQKLLERHNLLAQDHQENLQTRLAGIKNSIASLKDYENSGPALAAALEQQISLEAALENLTEGEIVVVARESIERVAPKSALIMVLAVVVGFIFALVTVFFAEFVSLVRKVLRKQV